MHADDRAPMIHCERQIDQISYNHLQTAKQAFSFPDVQCVVKKWGDAYKLAMKNGASGEEPPAHCLNSPGRSRDGVYRIYA
jgi:hypothetical protein